MLFVLLVGKKIPPRDRLILPPQIILEEKNVPNSCGGKPLVRQRLRNEDLASNKSLIFPLLGECFFLEGKYLITLNFLFLCALCLVTQLCPILCDPMDCNPSVSSVRGDAPGKNMSGLPCPPPGDLPNREIKPHIFCIFFFY